LGIDEGFYAYYRYRYWNIKKGGGMVSIIFCGFDDRKDKHVLAKQGGVFSVYFFQ